MLSRGILQCRNYIFTRTIRTFLSKQYKCTSDWESRLTSPLMDKIKLDTLYYEIDQAINQEGKASSIDVDIFVNKVNDDTHLDEVADLIHRLRKTEETSNCLKSTGHALIRHFTDCNNFNDLIQILDNPLEYGVFLDSYMANYIMDDCIKREDFTTAARIATFLMLQEDFSNELTKCLALYSCWRYLSNPESFYPSEEKKDDEPQEEVKVRVKFIRNEYFDDHFDLKDHKHLVGKTLAMIGIQTSGEIGKSTELLGQILYQKYDKAINILKTISPNNFYKDVLEKSLEFLQSSTEEKTDLYNEVHTLLTDVLSNKNLNQNNFQEQIEKLVKNTVDKNEQKEIENQKQIYKEWNKIRKQRLDDELKRLERLQKLKQIEKITKEMESEEQKLWFFENEEKINLQIDSKKVTYPKRWFGKKKKPRVIDEAYIPPEVIKQQRK